MNEIIIGDRYEDTLGLSIYTNTGKLTNKKIQRFVTISNKTSNSIEILDGGGFKNWITFDDFSRIERSNGKARFVKID